MSHLILGYIDPGSGSILLQFFIGSLVGAGLYFRHGIARFLMYFKKESN